MWLPDWRLKITNVSWDFEKPVFKGLHPEQLRLKRETRGKDVGHHFSRRTLTSDLLITVLME